ncbi:MAG: putative DNA modification/repair radical SAM protein [Treponema sp. GWB1_62_6]|nr:MAG: putative DNA modification/repair radical SAM protein [Treponema sp. GWA1_62_8]OHE65398.1 MAG: putative DNA modification/repair radical SAM protein [Treponema sp. GWC1_61_84]OHE70542.1 MAG: putative DNA modification/repair radical SAM protein [Treponema sp. GWB1_62_6]OHE73226.1 MAG: putative DNA modification/repair radical SAM protein [Treponema sp. RIFOXYC1_FULL_61_9]HCM25347.1 putative DNA modification/repair radical SAM protein [Treponema sp.]
MDTADKLALLADAAKYDASCSSSGSARENANGGIGNGAVGGVCHSWSADGRCISLLKVLLSNACAWDCAYCANRRSADVRRGAFEPEELVRLVIDFYKRNYIEGVFLSSGVVSCPDATMERLISVARTLRVRERFNGYIHLKVIPGASDILVNEAARWADRVSVNIELPSAASLARIAPDKTPQAIFGPMRTLARAGGFEPRRLIAEPRPLLEAPAPLLPARPRTSDAPGRRELSVHEARKDRTRNPGASVLPAGQTTQLVVGASPDSDAAILTLAENLYLAYDVRRVYYSAFVPVADDPRIPSLGRPPLLREHRLYQADWLFRFYGFTAAEILADGASLDDDLDPKSAWALRNLAFFPVDVNKAGYAELLRVPGIGPVSCSRILRARRSSSLRHDQLPALGVVMKRARAFVVCADKAADSGERTRALGDARILRALLADPVAARAPGEGERQLESDWRAGA